MRGLEEGDGRQQQLKKKGGSGKNNNKNGSNINKKSSTNVNNNLSNKKQFWTMTDIQNACIPHALRGRDILGAARTGR